MAIGTMTDDDFCSLVSFLATDGDALRKLLLAVIDKKNFDYRSSFESQGTVGDRVKVSVQRAPLPN